MKSTKNALLRLPTYASTIPTLNTKPVSVASLMLFGDFTSVSCSTKSFTTFGVIQNGTLVILLVHDGKAFGPP